MNSEIRKIEMYFCRLVILPYTLEKDGKIFVTLHFVVVVFAILMLFH